MSPTVGCKHLLRARCQENIVTASVQTFLGDDNILLEHFTFSLPQTVRPVQSKQEKFKRKIRYICVFNEIPPFFNVISKSINTYFLNFCKADAGIYCGKNNFEFAEGFISILLDDQSLQPRLYAERLLSK